MGVRCKVRRGRRLFRFSVLMSDASYRYGDYLSAGKIDGTESATLDPQVNGVFPYSRSMTCDEISQIICDGWPLHIMTLADALADGGV